jgi:hypothetical protein
MKDHKQQENLEYFNCLSSIIIDDIHVKLNPGLQGKGSIQQGDSSPTNWT